MTERDREKEEVSERESGRGERKERERVVISYCNLQSNAPPLSTPSISSALPSSVTMSSCTVELQAKTVLGNCPKV